MVILAQGAVGRLLFECDRLDEAGDGRRRAHGGRDVNVRRLDVIQHQRRRAEAAAPQRRARDVEHASRVLEGFQEGEALGEPLQARLEPFRVIHPALGKEVLDLRPRRPRERPLRSHLAEEVLLVGQHEGQLVVGATARNRRDHRARRRAGDHLRQHPQRGERLEHAQVVGAERRAAREHERFVAKGDVRRAQHRERGGRARCRRSEPAQRDANLGNKALDDALGAGARACVQLHLVDARHVGLEAVLMQQRHERRRVAALTRLAQPLRRRERVPEIVVVALDLVAPAVAALNRVQLLRALQPRRVAVARRERHLAPPPPGGPREHALDGERRVPHRRVRDQIGKNAREDDEQNRPPQHARRPDPAAQQHERGEADRAGRERIDRDAQNCDADGEHGADMANDVMLDVNCE